MPPSIVKLEVISRIRRGNYLTKSTKIPLETLPKKEILHIALSSNPITMEKAIPQTTVDLNVLERELEENGYDQEEIDGILEEARGINVDNFYAADSIYDFVYRMKMAEREW